MRCATVVIVALLGLGAAAAQESATVWDGVFTDEQAKRGETAYRQECSNCHGPELEGADMTPPLVGGDVHGELERLDALAICSSGSVRRCRSTSLVNCRGSRTPMSIAFMLKANMWPAGTTELSRELGALKQIRIQSSRPERKP